MGRVIKLKYFPQFSVDLGDSTSITDDSETPIFFVLDSLLHVMNLSLPVQNYPHGTIVFVLESKSPICYKESNLIFLNCSKNKWDQVTYQLAHEMCHLLIHGKTIPELRWLEESICELSSLYFLPKISKYWKRLGIPYQTSDGMLYSPLFEKYALDTHADITSLDLTLFTENLDNSELSSLVKDCYQRSKNRYIAIRFLPIFKHFPKTWNAVPYISEIPAGLSFADSLVKWIELSPMDSRIGLQELATVFGKVIPLP